FQSSPKGRRFTAAAVEGIRVKTGDDARADMRMIEGRRLRGTAVSAHTGKPLGGVPVFCYGASHPRSGSAVIGALTAHNARFGHFVPPGPAFVCTSEAGPLGLELRRIVTVREDRDPDPVILKQSDDSNIKESPGQGPPAECHVGIRLRSDHSALVAEGAERS